MKRGILLFFVLLSFFILSSCSQDNPYKLYKKGLYEEAFSAAESKIISSGKIDEKNLYVKAASLYNMKEFSAAKEAAKAYFYLFDGNKKRRESILRILLFTDSTELALSCGEELYSLKELTKEDVIQYYTVLNSLERYGEAERVLDNAKNMLSDREIIFAMVNGKARTDSVISMCEEIYKKEGDITPGFVTYMSIVLNFLEERGDRDKLIPFIRRTYSDKNGYTELLEQHSISINY